MGRNDDDERRSLQSSVFLGCIQSERVYLVPAPALQCELVSSPRQPNHDPTGTGGFPSVCRRNLFFRSEALDIPECISRMGARSGSDTGRALSLLGAQGVARICRSPRFSGRVRRQTARDQRLGGDQRAVTQHHGPVVELGRRGSLVRIQSPRPLSEFRGNTGVTGRPLGAQPGDASCDRVIRFARSPLRSKPAIVRQRPIAAHSARGLFGWPIKCGPCKRVRLRLEFNALWRVSQQLDHHARQRRRRKFPFDEVGLRAVVARHDHLVPFKRHQVAHHVRKCDVWMTSLCCKGSSKSRARQLDHG